MYYGITFLLALTIYCTVSLSIAYIMTPKSLNQHRYVDRIKKNNLNFIVTSLWCIILIIFTIKR